MEQVRRDIADMNRLFLNIQNQVQCKIFGMEQSRNGRFHTVFSVLLSEVQRQSERMDALASIVNGTLPVPEENLVPSTSHAAELDLAAGAHNGGQQANNGAWDVEMIGSSWISGEFDFVNSASVFLYYLHHPSRLLLVINRPPTPWAPPPIADSDSDSDAEIVDLEESEESMDESSDESVELDSEESDGDIEMSPPLSPEGVVPAVGAFTTSKGDTIVGKFVLYWNFGLFSVNIIDPATAQQIAEHTHLCLINIDTESRYDRKFSTFSTLSSFLSTSFFQL